MATILVVDDELGIRALLSEILTDEGHTVEAAEDAAQARTLREQLQPDLVLLDIWMPDVDGITLLKEWGSAGHLTMPVIMMSGHGTIDTAVEAMKFGANAFLEKPVTLQKLLRAVDEALNRGNDPRAGHVAAANLQAVAGGGAAVGLRGVGGAPMAASMAAVMGAGSGSAGGGVGVAAEIGAGAGASAGAGAGAFAGGLASGAGSVASMGISPGGGAGGFAGGTAAASGLGYAGGAAAQGGLGGMLGATGAGGAGTAESMERAAGLASGSQQLFELDRPLREARDAFEKSYFEYHLAKENGSMTRVAEKTGLERTHLYRKLKHLGVDLSRTKRSSH